MDNARNNLKKLKKSVEKHRLTGWTPQNKK